MQSFGKLHRHLHKLYFYFQHVPLGLLPRAYIRRNADDVLSEFDRLPEYRQMQIRQRVDYCNRLRHRPQSLQFSEYSGEYRRKSGWNSSYFYDLLALLRYFPDDFAFNCVFGDVTHVPDQPAFVKSRPIGADNENSVLLKLDSVRHFYIVDDPFEASNKLDHLVWRGAAHQQQRVRFLEQFHDHPYCDVGCVHKKSAMLPYHRAFMSVKDQLRYRFILSIEGNDVATNLKWIMASRSVAVMTRPKYETWLLEGLLEPEIHYIGLEDDYSDLDEKLDFYRKHPAAVERININARRWMAQFTDRKQELLVGLMVMQKYARILR